MSENSVNMAQAADENQVTYVAEDSQFQITVNGEQVDISTLEAVMFVLQQRYVAMSDVTAEKTREMQEQVNLIKEANRYLNLATEAAITGELIVNSTLEDFLGWMDSQGLDTATYQDPPNIQDFKHAQTQISNYVDQLASNNDLRMLSLKTAVNKAQQALTAADGILQNIKQLMQTLTSNLAR